MLLLAPLLTALLLPAPAALAPGVPSRGHVQDERVFQEVESWLRNFRRGSLDVREGAGAKRELEELIVRLRALRRVRIEMVHEVDLALLDLASLGLRESFDLPRLTRERLEERGIDLERSAERVRAMGMAGLRSVWTRSWSEEQAGWLARDVVLLRRQHSDQRRQVAMRLLTELGSSEGLKAVLTVAADERDDLRANALDALAGWPDPAADAFLLAQYDGRARNDGAPFRLLVQHVQRRRPLPDEVRREVLVRIDALLADVDWREATRGVELTRALSPEQVAIPLIDGLDRWVKRMAVAPGTGAKRVNNDILRELQSMSGLGIRLDAQAWRNWWERVAAGDVPLKRGTGEGPQGFSEASFFGLRPASDQVWFVVDLSGSMENSLGTSMSSRYDEAVQQLRSYLEKAGPQTRFGITLFNGETRRWRNSPQWASPAHIQAARSWLERQRPEGGTLLRPAIEEAMKIRSNGKHDLETLEVDTIVVLCDGETDSGPGWVKPFLTRYNEAARVMFHGVLVGHGGDGTLEALAEGSGGSVARWN